MDNLQAPASRIVNHLRCGEVSCDRATPPVPLFTGPVSQSTYCVTRARQSIANVLSHKDENSMSMSWCSSSLGQGQHPRIAKGARKRKACHPKRSDDGCEDLRRRQPLLASSDKEFVKVLGKASKASSDSVRSNRAVATRHRVGLSAHEAIAESQKRAKKREKKHSTKSVCSVIVSGVVVPLTPVPPRASYKNAHGTGVLQQAAAAMAW